MHTHHMGGILNKTRYFFNEEKMFHDTMRIRKTGNILFGSCISQKRQTAVARVDFLIHFAEQFTLS